MIYKTHILVLSLCFPLTLAGQIKPPEKPEFFKYDPSKNAGLENFFPVPQAYYSHSLPTYSPPQGATAGDIIRQTQQMNAAQHGIVMSAPPFDPMERDRFIREKARQAAMMNERKQFLDILNEAHAEQRKILLAPNYQSPEFLSKTKPYHNARQAITAMLEGKKPLSVKDAYFEIEKAYGDLYMTKPEYDASIKEAAAFIQKWLAQNRFDARLNSSLHTGIQRFMSDTLIVTYALPDKPQLKHTSKHLPFSYDYEDFKGEKDFRNFFLTKTLATGSGQCNSLPAVYLILAEALGTPAYLSFAPHHALIKYPGNDGLHNYEPTSNWNITDKWYMDHLFISPEAVMQGIYLDTVNKKQIVANCLLDLAQGYLKKFGLADGTFITECLREADKYFPRHNNITAYFLVSCCLARRLDRVLMENKVTDMNEIAKIPQAKALHDALVQNEEQIRQLGYIDPPIELYEQIMAQHEFKAKRQKGCGTNGKQKRNLYQYR